MKFRIHILIFLVVMIFGCTTLPPHDYGVYNQGDIGDDELVTLVFDGTLYLRSFNGENVWWGIAPDKGFILKMPAGNYVFPLNWEVGINHWKNIDLQINLEPGKTYSIKSNLKGLVLTITATDDETRNVVSSAVREFSGYRTVEARKLPSSEEIRARLANNPNLIRPNDILGKRLSGSDESGTFVFIFSDNNILEYTLNGKIYIGEWQYDESGPPILRYKIDWNEDGEPKGYGVDILRREGNNAVIQGYWYLTDAQIQFRKEVVIEE